MKRLLFAAAMLIAACPLAFAQTAQGATSKPAGSQAGSAEQVVAARVQEFFAALRKGDTAALGPFYTDDYTLTTETGAVRTKAQRLAGLKGGDAAGLATVEPSELRVRAYGGAAVVTGLVTITDGGSVIRERFTQVWVRHEGEWRMVAGQITAVAPAQPAEKKQ